MNVVTLVRSDIRNILRDRMLTVLPFVPFLAAVALRFLYPFLSEALAPYFDLRAYEPYVGAFFLLIGSCMMGFTCGFLFLDETEEGVLTSISVTPIGGFRFALLRLLIGAAIAFVSAALAWPLLGVPAPSVLRLLAATALASCSAPAIALFILAFARNKIEGLTIAKLAGFVLLAPIASAVIPRPWDRLAGVFPTWWAAAAFLPLDRGGLQTTSAAIGGILCALAWTVGFGTLARKKLGLS